MRTARLYPALLLLLLAVVASMAVAKDRPTRDEGYVPKSGDIVFQTSRSQLGPAIEIATGSRITHCGVVMIDSNEAYVYEAVGPVRRILLDEWIPLGVDERFAAKRLRGADSTLTGALLDKMRSVYSKFAGRDYDVQFNWSDDRLYCSELVYKMFDKGAGIDIGSFTKFGDFKLDDPLVQFWINRYFPDGPDLDEKVVSPVSVYNDSSLVMIYSTY